VSAGDGCWLAVLEQAYSQYALGKKGKEPIDEGEATDIISQGGFTRGGDLGLDRSRDQEHEDRAYGRGRKEIEAKVPAELRTELQATLEAIG